MEEKVEMQKRIREGTVTAQDVFVAADEDQSGRMSKYEFRTFTKRLGMNLSHHRINEIFANVKKVL
jgi:Ca2+-binding EF-hand superfamily protein